MGRRQVGPDFQGWWTFPRTALGSRHLPGGMLRRRAVSAAAHPLTALLLVLSHTAFPPASAARELPERFEATFTLEAKGTTLARSHWSLAPAPDGRFVSTSRTEPAGVFALIRKETRTERSEWRYAGDRIQPLAYRYERTGRKARTIAMTFDWAQNVARHSSEGQDWLLQVPPGTMDKLVYTMALMRDLDRGARRVEYSIADGGRQLKRYVLAAIGEERIETRIGALDTVVVRRERENARRETTLWCARALGFFPVKIVHVERGETPVTIRIQSITGIEPLGAPTTPEAGEPARPQDDAKDAARH